MTTKMTKKNSDFITNFEKNIIPMLNYKQINEVMQYLKETDFTPKQMEIINELLENKFSPISDIYKDKPTFNPIAKFAFMVPYFLNVKNTINKELKEEEIKQKRIEEILHNMLNVSKRDFVSYLTYSFIVNMESKLFTNYETEIIKELEEIMPMVKSEIKTSLKHRLGSLNSLSSNNINQLCWLLDNKMVSVNTLYGDKTLSFLASDRETLEFLKSKGADFSLQNDIREICTFYNKDIDSLKFLTAEGCDINHLNIYDKNFAFYMIKNTSIQIKDLNALGVNIHQFDNQELNILNYTTSLEQAKELLNYNVKIKHGSFFSEEVRDLVKSHQEKLILQNEVSYKKSNNLNM